MKFEICCKKKIKKNRDTYSTETQLDTLDMNIYVISCNMCNIIYLMQHMACQT